MTKEPDIASMSDAALAACLVARDPIGLGGVVLRAPWGPARDRWMTRFRALLPPDRPVRTLPLHASDDRIFGGLDLAATLSAGRPIAQRGVVDEAAGGFLILSMAERLTQATAGRLAVHIEQSQRMFGEADHRISPGLIALDEGVDADERVPDSLRDRLAFWIGLDSFDPGEIWGDMQAVEIAPSRVTVADSLVVALVTTGLALGVGSLRGSLLALAATRGIAALQGRLQADERDAAIAARLVFSPRATRIPAQPEETPPISEKNGSKEQANTDGRSAEAEDGSARQSPPRPLEDVVLEAAKSAIPPGLLLQLQEAGSRMNRATPGRAGAESQSGRRGRPSGVRHGPPTSEARLNVVETLRAAAPWQRLRMRSDRATEGPHRVEIRRDDLRVTRIKQRTETTTIFTVDASGSLAFARLAEAKGAVELLLADCYIRRDQVALLAFRGNGAELVLPPTRSLARAKRTLAALPGGGATPLAHAIDTAMTMAVAIRRRGQTPLVVFLTDGRGNVARDGSTGRDGAKADAAAAAKAASALGIRSLVIDAGQRPSADARALAETLGARYLPLPRADAASLSMAVRAVASA